jgi:excisionase family DNA binding protein
VVIKNETSYVEAQEAARMLGISQRAVRNLVARGRLEFTRDGEGVAARILISVASIEKLRLEQ